MRYKIRQREVKSGGVEFQVVCGNTIMGGQGGLVTPGECWAAMLAAAKGGA